MAKTGHTLLWIIPIMCGLFWSLGDAMAACIDSDPTNNQTTIGRVIINGKTVAVDSCVNNRVVETSCGFLGLFAKSFTPTLCTNGGTCENKKCTIPPPPPDLCANFAAPPEDACAKTICDPTKGVITTPKIKCADNQICDKYLEACVIKTATPPPPAGQCAVHEKPIMEPTPHFHVKPCDKIVFSSELGKVVVTIVATSPEAVSLLVRANIYGSPLQYKHYLTPSDVSKNDAYFNTLDSYDSGHANLFGNDLLFLTSSAIPGSNVVDLFTSSSCADAFTKCTTKAANAKQCYAICNAAAASMDPANDKVFDFSYSPPYVSAVSAPEGFSKAVELTQALASCIRGKLETLFGVADKKPTLISHIPSPNPLQTSCYLGGKHGNVRCQISGTFSDNYLTTGNPNVTNTMNSKLSEYLAKAQQGECINEYNFVGNALAHEMAHDFAMNNFAAMNSEGLATFIQYEVATGLDQSGKTQNLICKADGYEFGNNGMNYKYNVNVGSEHFSTACFLRELRDTYGPDTFKKIFQYVNTLKYGNYLLFKDIIHPIVKDNFFDKVKTKYGFAADPTVSQWRQNYFD